ncbi:MAG: sulfatase-like hydrolase/transferase [Candidatus Aminicenantes bacterium]|nr:sulfatase-like hydrolase/transferase [Candidatus Aminicenantes bacterium]
MKENLSTSVAATLLFSFTLFFFVPLQLYLTNSLEFDLQFPGLLLFLLLLAAASSLLLLAALALVPARSSLRRRAHVLLFAFGLLLWLQSYVLVWSYGPLDGRQIPWGEMVAFGFLDGAVWLAVLALSQWKLDFFSRLLKGAAWALLALQLLTGVYYFLSTPPLPKYLDYSFAKERQFDFSREKNVIVLVLDCFQSDLFQEMLDEDPAIRELFAGFTYFRNNLGGFPVTYASVPLILTGKYYDNSEPIQSFIERAFRSPSALPQGLTRNGIETDLFPASLKVVSVDPTMAANVRKRRYPFYWSDFGMFMDVALFRCLPHFAKRLVYNEQKWFLSERLPAKPFFFPFAGRAAADESGKHRARRNSSRPRAIRHALREAFGADTRRRGFSNASLKIPDVNFVYRAIHSISARRRKPVFKFYHLMGVHPPWRMDENFEPARLAPTRANWKRIVRGELKLVRIFFSLLADHGLFDRSLILLMGDHGHPRGQLGRVFPERWKHDPGGPGTVPDTVIAAANPLLLAKPFHSRGGLEISDAPVSLGDIAKTVFSELRIAADCPGESIFTVPETAARPRWFYFYTWTRDDWRNWYLPPFSEFRVDGHSWLRSSWRATGRVLRRP